MRQLLTAVVAVCLLMPIASHAQQAKGWVGKRVTTKAGTVLKVGRHVVDVPGRQPGASGDDRTVVSVYRVERVQGPWLWLVPETAGIRGWVKADQVVPSDQATDDRRISSEATTGIAGFQAAIGLIAGAAPGDQNPASAEQAKTDLGIQPVTIPVGKEFGIHPTLDDAIDPSRLDPKSADDFCFRGAYWQEQKEYDKAIADFSEAIRLEHDRVPAYVSRAGAWQAKRAYDKAIADMTEAIRIAALSADPARTSGPNRGTALLYRQRGDAWLAKGDLLRTIADYDEAIRRDPEDTRTPADRHRVWTTLRDRGAQKASMGDPDEAIADLTEAIRLEPGDASAHFSRAHAWSAKREYDRAIADWSEAIRQEPGESAAYGNRSNAWAHKKDFDKAIADITAAARINAGDVMASDDRSSAAKAKTARGKALAELTAAIRSPDARRAAGRHVLPEEIGRRYAARVGYEFITRDELKAEVQERLAKLPGATKKPTRAELKQLCAKVLDMLIERSMINQQAKQYLKDPAQRDAVFDRADETWREEELPPLAQRYGVKNESELAEKLAERGRSLDALRLSFRSDFLARGFLMHELKGKREVTDAEVRDEFEAHRAEYNRPELWTWREVLIEVANHPSRAAARSKAEAVHARLVRGDDFAAVAQAESEGPNRAAGGLWETEPGGYAVAAVDAALQSLPPGQLSAIIEGPSSEHILRVDARRSAGPAPFDRVQEQVRRALEKRKFDKEAEAYLETLRKQTAVTIFTNPGEDTVP